MLTSTTVQVIIMGVKTSKCPRVKKKLENSLKSKYSVYLPFKKRLLTKVR